MNLFETAARLVESPAELVDDTLDKIDDAPPPGSPIKSMAIAS